MSKIILDTNIFVAAILSPDGTCRRILRHVLSGDTYPIMGDALYYEYEDVLDRDELFRDCAIDREEREDLFAAFLVCCDWVKVYYKWRPNLRDEGDNHLIELAVAGGVTEIVTRNVKDLKSGELYFEHLRILTPDEYLKEEGWER